MKPKTLTLLSVVTVLLIVGGVLLYYGITARFQEKTIYVVRPGADIEANTLITKELLKATPKKVYYLPTGTIMDNAMIGKYAKTKLLAGREINSREVDNEPTVDTGLGFNLKPGDRIVSVTADNSDSIGGMIASGLFVDLEWIEKNANEATTGVPLYSHLEVLDVRTKNGVSLAKKDETSKNSSPIKFVADGGEDLKDQYPLEIVLRVTEQQQRAILLAKESGKVALGINPNNESQTPLPPLTTEDLKNGVNLR